MKKITERKKKKKRPSTLRKAINRDCRKRWFEANPEVLIAKKTCLKMNMYLNVALNSLIETLEYYYFNNENPKLLN